MQNKKDTLISYAKLQKEVTALIDERKMWLNFLQTLSSKNRNDKITEAIWKLDFKLNVCVIEQIEMRNAVEEIIAKVDDCVLRAILRRRYLLGENFETIAEQLNYSWRHTIRLHDKAISAL